MFFLLRFLFFCYNFCVSVSGVRDARGGLRVCHPGLRLPRAPGLQNQNQFPPLQGRRAEPKPVAVPEIQGGAGQQVPGVAAKVLTAHVTVGWTLTNKNVERSRKRTSGYFDWRMNDDWLEHDYVHITGQQISGVAAKVLTGHVTLGWALTQEKEWLFWLKNEWRLTECWHKISMFILLRRDMSVQTRVLTIIIIKFPTAWTRTFGLHAHTNERVIILTEEWMTVDRILT